MFRTLTSFRAAKEYMSSNQKQKLSSEQSQSATFPPTPPSTPAVGVGEGEDTPKLIDEKDSIIDNNNMKDGKDAPDAADLQASAPAADATEDAPAEAADAFIRNLCILPPRQKSNNPNARPDLDALGAIPVPPLRPEEPVQSIRAALGEVKGYAHLTNYRLVIEERPDGIEAALAARRRGTVDGTAAASSSAGTSSAHGASKRGGTSNASKKSKKKKPKGSGGGGGGGSGSGSNTPRGSSPFNKTVAPTDIVSPHTGPNAIVSIPATVRSLEADPAAYTPFMGSVVTDSNSNVDGGDEEEVVLDEFTDLSPYMDHGLNTGNAALRMVLERYDVASVRDHVARLRLIFDGLVPYVTTLAEGEEEGGEEKKMEEKEEGGGKRQQDKEADSGGAEVAVTARDEKKKVRYIITNFNQQVAMENATVLPNNVSFCDANSSCYLILCCRYYRRKRRMTRQSSVRRCCRKCPLIHWKVQYLWMVRTLPTTST